MIRFEFNRVVGVTKSLLKPLVFERCQPSKIVKRDSVTIIFLGSESIQILRF